MLQRLMFLVLLSLWRAPPARAQSDARAEYDESTRAWILSNNLIRAEFRLLDSNQFRLFALGRPGGKQWIEAGEPATSPIYLNVDGSVLDWRTAWTLDGSETERAERGGVRQLIHLRNEEAKAEVTIGAEVYSGQPFVRTWYSYRNADEKRHVVRAARFFDLRFKTGMSPIGAFYVDQSRQGSPASGERTLPPSRKG